ncbi:MAG: flagellar biosynthesis regulatory protein FlaF [Alphaproteobacteria bacterium]|nr:flagellar biosynthesis regulatory protein FlaF [Alphaproteobacteria bacterium]
MSLNAYQRTLKNTENPRNTEYRLFAEITRDLLEAQQRGMVDGKLVEAVDRNRKLWIALGTDCASDDNLLPKETRAAIVSLSIWVQKYSREVTRKGEDIAALIDVNRNIMKGLNPNATAV